MKLKSISMILTILSSIIGIAGCTMIFMKLELPTTMVTICTILLFIVSMSEFMITGKLRKLAYPLIMIYFFVGMPIIERFIENRILNLGFAVFGCVITIIFIFNDLIITNKEKNLSH